MLKFRLFLNSPYDNSDIIEFEAKNLNGAKIRASSFIRHYRLNYPSSLGDFCNLFDDLGNKLASYCVNTSCWEDFTTNCGPSTYTKGPKFFVLGYAYYDDYNIPFGNEYYSDLCERFPLTDNIDFAKHYKTKTGCVRAIKSRSLKRALKYMDYDKFIPIPCYD